MARRPIPSSVLGPNGKPAAYYFFEGGARRWQDTVPLWYWSGARDTKDVLQTYTWRQLMVCGRFLFANVPMLRGAVLEQANYAFPLERHYMGKDEEWGEEASAMLRDWDQQCTFRGAPFDTEALARMRLIGSVSDGDIFTVLTSDPDSGVPKVQLVRAHRVGDRNVTGTEPILTGPYRNARILNGIITDKVGRTLAFQILGDTEPDDEQIPMESGVMTFRPTYPDQIRGITEMVASINSFDDIKRLNEYEMRAQQIFASQTLIEKNETGFADDTESAIRRPVFGTDNHPATSAETANTATGLITETYEAGLTRYFRSGSGSGLEPFRADRPSADASAFEARIVARAFYGIEWDPFFALCLKEPGGAWARTIINKVNRRLTRVQAVEARVRHRTDVHALSHFIYSLGTLRAPKDGDLFSWGYRGPARITADSGNEATAKRNDYILGLRTLEMHCIEDGRDWRHLRKQRYAETSNLLEGARALLKEFPELGDLVTAAKFLEDRNPNTAPAQKVQAGQEDGNGKPMNPGQEGEEEPEEPEEEDED